MRSNRPSKGCLNSQPQFDESSYSASAWSSLWKAVGWVLSCFRDTCEGFLFSLSWFSPVKRGTVTLIAAFCPPPVPPKSLPYSSPVLPEGHGQPSVLSLPQIWIDPTPHSPERHLNRVCSTCLLFQYPNCHGSSVLVHVLCHSTKAPPTCCDHP